MVTLITRIRQAKLLHLHNAWQRITAQSVSNHSELLHYNANGLKLYSTKKLPAWRINQYTTSFSFSSEISKQPFTPIPVTMADNRYSCDYAKLGTSKCKKCKEKLDKGGLRIAKVVANPFSEEGGDMKQYHHPKCMFETFIRARNTTKIIEDLSDVEGIEKLEDSDKDLIKELIRTTLEKKGSPKKAAPKKPKKSPGQAEASPFKGTPTKPSTEIKDEAGPSNSGGGASSGGEKPPDSIVEKDNSFRQFRRLCADIAEENSYNGKTQLVATYLKKGNSGSGFHGDVYLLMKLLLPGVVKTVYNLNNKQLVKIFSPIFGTSLPQMVEDLEQGDVAETIRVFFDQSKYLPPQKKSTLSLKHVDDYLTELSQYTKEEDQGRVLKKIAKESTANDLKMVVRLIKHDLRINAGAKHILDGLDPNAYEAFQASRNLRDVVDRVFELRNGDAKPGLSKKLSVRANLMTPLLPMLAEPCKSVEFAFKRCPQGMFAEIKYDGERVQVHKKGDSFQYFSRSLKPVLPHKVNHFKEYIPQAFPNSNDLILDAEVLLIDTNTSKPLPFGTLGIHKQQKQAFKDANVALFIFDCIHINGETLIHKPIKERRKILKENMKEIKNRILFSEMKHITEPADLKDMMMKVFREGLEGLVLKDVNSTYEPGKRHWLKVKKDYLADGMMADTADLVVLGAYFGTGNKGGMMSIFLMGVHDPDSGMWCTVSKCGSGFDDETLEKLQKQFDMVKISKDFSKVPSWLNINRNLTPDFVVSDPKKSQVWEITGAEFSKSESHTADGISIRFPRCTKMRDDKTWETATSLPELRVIFKKSKEYSDIPDFLSPKGGGGKWKKKTPVVKSEESENGDSNGHSSAHSTPVKTPVKRKAAEPVKASPSKETKKEHLPDVFKGISFYLPEDLPNRETLYRYIFAFDGEVVPQHEKNRASRLVVKTAEEVKSPRHAHVKWLWKCIGKKKLLPDY